MFIFLQSFLFVRINSYFFPLSPFKNIQAVLTTLAGNDLEFHTWLLERRESLVYFKLKQRILT